MKLERIADNLKEFFIQYLHMYISLFNYDALVGKKTKLFISSAFDSFRHISYMFLQIVHNDLKHSVGDGYTIFRQCRIIIE